MRITLIHALKHSIVPIEASFAKLWPDARLMNLLDDSLSADLARDGGLTDGDDRAFPEARALRGRHRFRCDPVHLFGLRSLHRSCGPRAGADAGAEAERGDDRAGRHQGPQDRPALDVRADAGVDAAGISGVRSSWCRSWRKAPWPRSTAATAPGMIASSCEASKDLARLRPDRAGPIQHGARGGAGGGSIGPAGADHAGQCGA